MNSPWGLDAGLSRPGATLLHFPVVQQLRLGWGRQDGFLGATHLATAELLISLSGLSLDLITCYWILFCQRYTLCVLQCRLWGKLIGCFLWRLTSSTGGGKSVELDQTINLRVGIGIYHQHHGHHYCQWGNPPLTDTSVVDSSRT